MKDSNLEFKWRWKAVFFFFDKALIKQRLSSFFPGGSVPSLWDICCWSPAAWSPSWLPLRLPWVLFSKATLGALLMLKVSVQLMKLTRCFLRVYMLISPTIAPTHFQINEPIQPEMRLITAANANRSEEVEGGSNIAGLLIAPFKLWPLITEPLIMV